MNDVPWLEWYQSPPSRPSRPCRLSRGRPAPWPGQEDGRPEPRVPDFVQHRAVVFVRDVDEHLQEPRPVALDHSQRRVDLGEYLCDLAAGLKRHILGDSTQCATPRWTTTSTPNSSTPDRAGRAGPSQISGSSPPPHPGSSHGGHLPGLLFQFLEHLDVVARPPPAPSPSLYAPSVARIFFARNQ